MPGWGVTASQGQRGGHSDPGRKLRGSIREGHPMPLLWNHCMCGSTQTRVHKHSAARGAMWQGISVNLCV